MISQLEEKSSVNWSTSGCSRQTLEFNSKNNPQTTKTSMLKGCVSVIQDVDVVVIGGGQAGLAMGYHLGKKSIDCLVLESNPRVGDSWRNRYDSLQLFTPRAHSSLPGLKQPGNPNGYPSKNEVADYLELYASHHNIPVITDTTVEQVVKYPNGFRLKIKAGEFTARSVIVATGPFQKPFTPELPGTLSDSVYQVHAAAYRKPSELKEGPVLVVGAGNSGVQIAAELTTGRDVYLSVGKPMKFLPNKMLGRSIFWWFDKLGLARASIHSKIGQKLSQNDPIIGKEIQPLLAMGAVKLCARAQSVSGRTVTFADGKTVEVSNIIWATGYRDDYDWLQIPGVFDGNGKVIHERGKTPVPGLYFIGLPWQYRRGSALLLGVGEDAEYLAGLL